MAPRNLEALVTDTDDLVGHLRENGQTYGKRFPVVPREVTNWIDEQRAVVEACALGDLSHHMTPVHVEGPDARELFADLCVNDFDDFAIGRAKHVVMCNHRGELLGDGPLLRLGEEEFWGVPTSASWLEYNVETGEYDVEATFDPPSPDGEPDTFIYQIQGPNAMAVLEAAAGETVRDIGFYQFDDVTIAGHDVRALGHGMNTEPGLELHGPYEQAAAVKAALLEAGRPHGIRELGSIAYGTQSVRLGWIPAGPPPIYDVDELLGYREWLPADGRAGTYSIEGSFDSDDLSDYYTTPVEQGYGKLVDLDHDFVGKAAVARELSSPDRSLVSLRWDDESVIELYRSLFEDGSAGKLFHLPRSRRAMAAFDSVLVDGTPVGVSRRRSYQPDVRSIVSLAVVDRGYTETGTEVRVVWGGGDEESRNPRIEAHTPREIEATVGPVPYSADGRQ